MTTGFSNIEVTGGLLAAVEWWDENKILFEQKMIFSLPSFLFYFFCHQSGLKTQTQMFIDGTILMNPFGNFVI